MSDQTNNQVTIYTTSRCAFCHTEMQWMDKLGVPYTNKNIEEDEAAKDEMLDKIGGEFRGVPVTSVGDEVIMGFDRVKLEDAFKSKSLIS